MSGAQQARTRRAGGGDRARVRQACEVHPVQQMAVVTVHSLPAAVVYSGNAGVARWDGYEVSDEGAFRTFLRGPVARRMRDVDIQATFEDELQALATTGMATGFLGQLLASSSSDDGVWEIGEAFAETVLAEDSTRTVIWPWHGRRDRRTPRASLPGADLVGFCRDARGWALLFGEVKTSADARVPPRVMLGPGGMTWQLEQGVTQLGVQHSLLRWLRLRCATPEHVAVYREAVGRYLDSAGRDLLLVGVLLRDTNSDERDVAAGARQLAGALDSPARVEIMAWYLPVAIVDWPAALEEVA